MKTSKLIKLLQDADPNDECTICIMNHPVRYIDRMPYYYDGRLEHIEREDDEYGKVLKVGYKSGGDKIKIHFETIEDALMDYPDAELELSGVTYQGKVDSRHMNAIERWRKDGKEYLDWRKQCDDAKKKGLPTPEIIIRSEADSLQHKMYKWLQAIGIVKDNE